MVTVEIVLQIRNAAREMSATFFIRFRFDAREDTAALLADTGGVTDEPLASSCEVVTTADGKKPCVCMELWRNPFLSNNALLRVYAWEDAHVYTWRTDARLSAFPDILLTTINSERSCEVLSYYEVGRESSLETVLRQGAALDVVLSIEPEVIDVDDGEDSEGDKMGSDSD